MMMNLPLIVIISTFVMGMAAAADVAAAPDFRRALLNNIGDGKAQQCNDLDWQMIDNILIASTNIVGTGHRYLRSKEERALQLSASQCKTKCAGYATGYCPVSGCGWYNTANSIVAPLTDTSTTALPAPDGVRHLSTENEKGRALQLSASQCKAKCTGYATGYCPVPGCGWYNTANSIVAPLTDTSTTSQPAPDGVRHLSTENEKGRALQLSQSQCKAACAGYVSGRCPVPGCGWYNTANSIVAPLLDTSTTSQPAPDGVRSRKLEYEKDSKLITTPCTSEQIKYINHELNRLVRTKAVTSSCQTLLKDSRHVVCYRRNDDFNELNTGTVM